MNFINYLNKNVIKEIKDLELKESAIQSNIQDTSINKTDFEYFQEKDEDGLSFDIPLLSKTDPLYFRKYVYYMKLKEKSPETFKKVIGWE